jgi:hypothetical protein
MKNMAGFAMALGLLSTIAVPTPEAEAQVIANTSPLTVNAVFISCSNSGGQQDVAKSPSLKNTTTATIPKGYVLSWSASDGDKGTVTLGSDLAPGATVKAQGTKPGNVYTCNASFQSKPDLVIQNVTWATGNQSLAVKLANLDAWVGAGQSAVHLEMLSCKGTVLKSAMVGAGSVPKAGSTNVSFSATLPQQKYYFRIKADAASQISERNEGNNLWDGISACY